MHEYFHVQGVTDLAVTRDQANTRLKPSNKFTNKTPEESVIHMHKHNEPCSPLIEHEFFAVPPQTGVELRIAYWENFAHNTGGSK